MHNLTSAREYSLRIDMEDFAEKTRYANYSNFAVGPEEDGFRISVTGYSGTAGLYDGAIVFQNSVFISQI